MTDTASTGAPASTDAPATDIPNPGSFFAELFQREDGDDAEAPSGDTPADEDGEASPETDDAESPDGEDEASDDDAAADDDEGTEEAEDADEEYDGNQLIPVKVDGKVEQVTLDELKKGYSRTKVFTQKTQEAAEIRRAAEAARAETMQEREALAKAIEAVTAQLTAADPEPDWDALRETDRDEYLFQKAVWAEKQEKRDKLERVKTEMERRNAADRQAALAETLKGEQAALLEKVPAWKDEAKAKAELEQIRRHAIEDLGFPAEMLDQVYDHRLVLLLRNSARYATLTADKDKLPTKAGDKAKIIEKRPKALKPGATKKDRSGIRERRRAAAERVRETGTTRDAEEFFRVSGLFD